MKIGFYLQNQGVMDVDCSHPLTGNPGVGGTEYLFTAIPYAIFLAAGSDKAPHQVCLLANSLKGLPGELSLIQADDNTLSGKIEEAGLDMVVIRYSLENIPLLESIQSDVKIVYWAHNFISRSELTVLARNKKVAAIVCVGTEQLHFYRDHSAFYKSVVICNGYPVRHFIAEESASVRPFNKRGNEVTFLGNLVEYKGFHLLAKAWKKVLAQVPDAHLHVIGGGKLYDRNQVMGKWGIAEESYENEFMPYLLDLQGDLLDSVTFHGVMGNEKAEILNRTKVGVPNPSGVSETFCIAALEMQLWGAVVTTIDYAGFKDTVYRSGLLYQDADALADCIVAQLKKEENDYTGFLRYALRFDFKEVAAQWLLFFDAMQRQVIPTQLQPETTAAHRWTEFNRRIKKRVPFGRFLPTMMFYQSIKNRLWK